MGPYSKIPVTRVIHSSQRCSTSRVGSDIAITSSPVPSRRPHSMLDLPCVILIEKME